MLEQENLRYFVDPLVFRQLGLRRRPITAGIYRQTRKKVDFGLVEGKETIEVCEKSVKICKKDNPTTSGNFHQVVRSEITLPSIFCDRS